MRKLLALASACLIAFPCMSLAQGGPGSTPSNAVGLWGVNTSSGAPCLVAPVGATGSATCILPTTGGGGGGSTVSLVGQTSGGDSVASGSIGATPTAIKASAGQIYAHWLGNANGTGVYYQFFDLAAGSVTLGSTTPKYSIYVPAGGNNPVDINGIAFATAITMACTTTRAGSTAPASTCDYTVAYK